jgi:DNA-binding NtrC family response regulator
MRKILVIDDERPTLTMFTLFLEAFGYAVLTAASGEEGIELYRKERPPIVFTDIKMPRMDGIEVLKQIKALDPRTEVIVITGHGDMELALQSLNLDAADFINKPIQRRALEQALNRAEARLRLISSKVDEFEVLSIGEVAVIRIQGAFNAASEPFMEDAYRAALALSKRKLIISLAENASVNGAGLAILAQVLLKAKKQGLSPAVVTPALNLGSIFDIVGISKLAPIFSQEAAAGLEPL